MRHVIQLSGPASALVALCDDGTIWGYKSETASWAQLPLVPGQPGTPEATEAEHSRDKLALERQEHEQKARRERFEGRK
jgi:hypothetical protein